MGLTHQTVLIRGFSLPGFKQLTVDEATMFPDEPSISMHRSATIDFGYVVSGRCVLELDDGSKTELDPGDVIVQSGTAHRWSNPWDEPCVLIGEMIGAHMK